MRRLISKTYEKRPRFPRATKVCLTCFDGAPILKMRSHMNHVFITHFFLKGCFLTLSFYECTVFSRLDIHFATRCHFPSCQKVTNPSTCIFAASAAFLSRAVGCFRLFLCFCFLELPTRLTGTLFVSFGFLALDCCARLPGGATERKEKILLRAMSWHTMASTSPCTLSSCASAGFASSRLAFFTFCVRSLQRRSSPRAFALQ